MDEQPERQMCGPPATCRSRSAGFTADGPRAIAIREPHPGHPYPSFLMNSPNCPTKKGATMAATRGNCSSGDETSP